jgi:hypothetical protein
VSIPGVWEPWPGARMASTPSDWRESARVGEHGSNSIARCIFVGYL